MTIVAQVVLASRPDEVARLAAALECAAAQRQWPPRVLFAFQLCLEEWVTNLIKYGYHNEPGHCIEVVLSDGDGCYVAEVSDAAAPFDPLVDAPPPDLAAGVMARPIGGLGVYLIRQLMDELRYWQQDGRNHLRMTKHAPPGAE